MAAQIAQDCGGTIGAEQGRPLIFTASHQRSEIRHAGVQRRILTPSSLARAGIGRIGEAAGVERHRPSIRRAEPREGRHRGAGYAVSNRLVKGQHAAFGSAGAIGEINLTVAQGTVASGTGSGVDPRASCEIRRHRRCGRDWVGGQQCVGEAVRLPRDRVR